jgi:hypothetical protein
MRWVELSQEWCRAHPAKPEAIHRETTRTAQRQYSEQPIRAALITADI